LGTFEGLDGELIAIDGKFYQVKGDGEVKIVTDDLKTPFSAVTFFQKEQSLSLLGDIIFILFLAIVDREDIYSTVNFSIRWLKLKHYATDKSDCPITQSSIELF
jgi:acetolactate decarboxylase